MRNLFHLILDYPSSNLEFQQKICSLKGEDLNKVLILHNDNFGIEPFMRLLPRSKDRSLNITSLIFVGSDPLIWLLYILYMQRFKYQSCCIIEIVPSKLLEERCYTSNHFDRFPREKRMELKNKFVAKLRTSRFCSCPSHWEKGSSSLLWPNSVPLNHV